MSDGGRWDRAQDVFLAVLEEAPDGRDALVEKLCDGDEALADEVRSLLMAHDSESWLGHLPDESDAPRLFGLPSDHIGEYRIKRPLGQGGMGTVFLAERTSEDITQLVALKLIRSDYAAPGLLDRFRNERRILARLEHPGIARLIDAGATATGQPFFAMEFVEGMDLIHFARVRKLSLRDRLQLFLDVCDAVEYAHQQLVVHRDLKPSNILVGEEGRPKLLDFGIAKIVDPDDEAVRGSATTRTGRFFTPEYASPEQVRGEPVATRSDVYALGVVLYELLTTVRPFDLRGRSAASIERSVCHEQPKRPSERVDDQRARRLLSGDLDTIIMKAVAKEPARRYASVRLFSDDVRRYLTRQPVLARPDSWVYRTSKFFQRHRTASIAALIAAVSLGVGIGSIAWQGAIARQERDRAEEALRQSQDVAAFLTNLFMAADPNEAAMDTATARGILRRGVEEIDALQDQPLLQARMLDALATVFMNTGEFNRAHEMATRGLRLRRANLDPAHRDIAISLRNIGQALQRLSRYEEAENVYLEAVAILRPPGNVADSLELIRTLENLGFLMPYFGRLEDANRYYREVLAMNRRLHGDDHPSVASSLMRVGLSLRRQGRYAEALDLIRESVDRHRRDPAYGAEAGTGLFHLADVIMESGGDTTEAEVLYREGIEMRRAARGGSDVGVIHGLENLGLALSEQGRHDEAEALLREALEVRTNAYGAHTPGVASTLAGLASALSNAGKYDAALEMMYRSLDTWQSTVGPEHASVAGAYSGLGMILLETGRYEEAEAAIRESLAMRAKLHGPEHPLIGLNYARLGRVLTRRGAHAEAEEVLLRAVEILERRVSPDHIDLRSAHSYLADLYGTWGKPVQAAAHRRMSER